MSKSARIQSRRSRSSRLNPTEFKAIRALLLNCVTGAGKVLLSYFGQITHPRPKESLSSIVCDADLASEAYLLRRVRAGFPHHGIISEESGCYGGAAEFTWVMDPLDGTSNFVAGVPWFGVQIGILYRGVPVLAAMYLPVEKTLYFAEQGQGAWRNGRPVKVTDERSSQNVLCAFGFDPDPAARPRAMAEVLFRVSQVVRNTRATNSLVDFCYTIDGRFGACVNLKTKIWDIVPVSLILPEAGGRFSYLDGREIVFELDEHAPEREYAILGASKALYPKLLAAVVRKG